MHESSESGPKYFELRDDHWITQWRSGTERHVLTSWKCGSYSLIQQNKRKICPRFSSKSTQQLKIVWYACFFTYLQASMSLQPNFFHNLSGGRPHAWLVVKQVKGYCYNRLNTTSLNSFCVLKSPSSRLREYNNINCYHEKFSYLQV